MVEQETTQIQSVITRYFDGLFYGDLSKLESAFHPLCLLVGDINGQPYLKNLPDYLTGVKNRTCPHKAGETFQMKTVSIELLNGIASVKLHCPLLGYNYYDYLSMSKIEGRWLIVHKLFTHVEP